MLCVCGVCDGAADDIEPCVLSRVAQFGDEYGGVRGVVSSCAVADLGCVEEGGADAGEEPEEFGLVSTVTEETTFCDATSVVIRSVNYGCCDMAPYVLLVKLFLMLPTRYLPVSTSKSLSS